MPLYNGVSLIPWEEWSVPDSVMSSDACLVVCGAWVEGQYFHAQFPDFILAHCPSINSLELLAIVVAIKLWGASWKGKRIRILCDNIPHQAAPVSPSILLEIFNLLDVSKPVDAVFWSLFLFAFFTLARKSNLVADLVTRRGRQVLRRDVSPSADGLLVIFYWTKTLQDRSRALHIPLVSIPGSPLCPVQAYLNMICLVPAAPSKPAFVLPTSKSVRAVSYADFMLVLRKLVALIGLDPSKFSTHSFRRGGTTYAFQAEVPDILIKAQGDWSSSAYLSYIDMSVSRRRTVGIKMRDRILSGNWVSYHPAPIRSVPQRPD